MTERSWSCTTSLGDDHDGLRRAKPRSRPLVVAPAHQQVDDAVADDLARARRRPPGSANDLVDRARLAAVRAPPGVLAVRIEPGATFGLGPITRRRS